MTHQDLDPALMRKQYRSEIVAEESLEDDPMRQFTRWFQQAANAHLFEPNAMIVSTATSDGLPAPARCC